MRNISEIEADYKFETDYRSIVKKIEQIDPIKYGKDRNYINGSVTYLSPYISRGVISTKQILAQVLSKGYQIAEIEPFVKELCWRDYFQRLAQAKNINQAIKQEQLPVLNNEIATNILNAKTGIIGIDQAINRLLGTGYMHNHCRMYTASITCNIAKSHWFHPAQWMYYHLLDGDWASNACSWQWIVGANSFKKYFANQENINKYTNTNQTNTFLDKPYEELQTIATPDELLNTERFVPILDLPALAEIKINKEIPTFIYNYYNLDPLWHNDEKGNRILLIEPAIFQQYPISRKCINFMLDLSKNIPDIQLYVGSFKSLLASHQLKNIYYKEHPFNISYIGIQEERDWIAKDVIGYHPSFFSFWEKAKKQIIT